MTNPEKVVKQPNPHEVIGIRPLTLEEQLNADMLGLPGEVTHTLTPAELDERADALIDDTNVQILLGA